MKPNDTEVLSPLSPQSPIHVLLCTDARFAPYCGVTVTSVLENAEGLHTVVHIFTDGMSRDDIWRFKQLEHRYDCRIDIRTLSESELSHLPRQFKQWPAASFMRLLAARMLSADVSKIIYIDCDCIVDTPLVELWSQCLDDKPCAAIADGPNDAMHQQRVAALKIAGTYFNSGVMIFDLTAMRECGVLEDALRTLNSPGCRFQCPDQDVLNILLSDQCKLLPITYNLQSSHLLRDRDMQSNDTELLINQILNRKARAIIHYTSEFKPWSTNLRNWHPLRHIWHKYRRLSPWRDKARPDIGWRTRFAFWRLASAYRYFGRGFYAPIWKHHNINTRH